MSLEVEIDGESEEAVALALLKLIARAEGRMDEDGEPKGMDRAWILDTYAQCLVAVYGERPVPADEEIEDDEEEDEEDVEEEDGADRPR